MKVVLTASGGGHTGYAVAVAEALLSRGHKVVLIVDPSDKWSIAKIRKRLGDIDLVYFRRLRSPKEGLDKLIARFPRRLAESHPLYKVLNDVDIAICTGSNHGLIPSIIARIIGKKVLCIEAVDRIVTRSKTVALLHDIGIASAVLHWPSQRRLYKRGVVVGPIYEGPIYKPDNKDYILVITGTEGNPALIAKLLRTRLNNVIVQTGRSTPPSLIKKYKPKWRAIRYYPDIAKLMAEASLVIAHQGLSIVEAALAYRKPVLLVLNPDLPNTSGENDAENLAKYLNTRCINPRRITPQGLEKEIQEAMERTPPSYPGGAVVLADYIRKMLNIA